MPISASDDGYFGPPDDNYMPVFDRGPDDVRVNAAPASSPAPAVDSRPLPPAVPLDPLGFNGDWPALAVDLPLKGISYQLAFNSELMALEGNTLKLNVPVPQYAEASQVAKLKAALAERLGQTRRGAGRSRCRTPHRRRARRRDARTASAGSGARDRRRSVRAVADPRVRREHRARLDSPDYSGRRLERRVAGPLIRRAAIDLSAPDFQISSYQEGACP